MTTGAYISGALHLTIILWVVLGGVLFNSEDPDVLESTNVTLVSQEEFLALTAVRSDLEVQQEITAPSAPENEIDPAVTPSGEGPPELAPRPDIAPPSDPDASPEPPDLTLPAADVEAVNPDAPVAPEITDAVTLLPSLQPPGRPKDAPVVTLTPSPETPDLPQQSPDFVAPAAPEAPSPEEAQPETEEPPAAPEETTTEIVTEADKEEPRGATVTAIRPRLRPPERAPAPEPDVETGNSGGGETAPETETVAAPEAVGPPLSFGEVDELVVAMQGCWSIGAMSTAAASSTVVVGVSMNPNGTPIASSIRQISASGPDDRSIKFAYEYARRAILKCGRRGLPLPSEKYAHWKEIEMTFSPEQGLLFE